MRNVREVLVVVGVVAFLILLALLLLPNLERAGRTAPWSTACAGDLYEIAHACSVYQDSNGGYLPAFMQGCLDGQSNPNIPQRGQGSDNTFQPMASLACLYPAYVDNVSIFRCPATKDRALIAIRYYNGARHTCFGFDVSPNQNRPDRG